MTTMGYNIAVTLMKKPMCMCACLWVCYSRELKCLGVPSKDGWQFARNFLIYTVKRMRNNIPFFFLIRCCWCHCVFIHKIIFGGCFITYINEIKMLIKPNNIWCMPYTALEYRKADKNQIGWHLLFFLFLIRGFNQIKIFCIRAFVEFWREYGSIIQYGIHELNWNDWRWFFSFLFSKRILKYKNVFKSM